MEQINTYSAEVNSREKQSVPDPKPEKTPADRVTIVCMRWGNPFPKDYVRVLYHGVKSNISRDFDFVCLSDDLQPICDGVRVLPIPELKLAKEKWALGFWPKLTVFKPGLFPAGRPVLFLDLDVLILKPLDPVLDRLKKMRGLHMLREWNPGLWNLVPLFMRPDRGGQSSMFAFYPEEQVSIYKKFEREDAAGAFSTYIDQMFISLNASNLSYLPYHFAASFKKHCVHYYPLNLLFKKIRQPRRAMVVVFHGKPKPTDLIRDDQAKWGTDRKFGHGPVDWVKSYWAAGIGGNSQEKIAA